MKAIIMAAGRGTRISRYINNRPKCTVDLGNETLIENTVKKLKSHNIDDIAIILGYKGEIIKEKLRNYNIKYYYNPFFDITNSIVSLWFAQEFLENDDLILMNADVFCESEIIEQILNDNCSPVLYADNSRKEEADYKFYYKNNILIKYGKELTGDDITGEYIGAARVNEDFLPIMKERLNELISQQKHNLWWEDVLYSLNNDIDIYVHDINNYFWAEVDYVEDYKRILEFIKSNKQYA